MAIRIYICTLPCTGGQNPGLANLVAVLRPLAEEIFVVSESSERCRSSGIQYDANIHFLDIIKHDRHNRGFILRVINHVFSQIKLAYHLIKASKRINLVVFYVGSTLVIPMLTAKVLAKKTALITTGSATESSKHPAPESLSKKSLYFVVALMEQLNFRLSDIISVYSPSLITECGLEKYQGKILVAHKHFLDFNAFWIEKILTERDDLIGYIGRLSKEKGVMSFIKAIPKVLEVRENSRFLIIGQGPIHSKIEEFLNEHNLNDKVSLLAWIPHDEMPKYLNELKLLVLPSYTEGLPNIVLEAMACGTPVLATPVGSIPDLIKDGETGFILENNKPEIIAEGILRALNHPKLGKIVDNARRLVEQNYTYETAVASYKDVLASLKVG